MGKTGVVCLLLGVALLCGPACSTVGTLVGADEKHGWFFSGTRANAEPFDPNAVVEFRGIRQICSFIDFPCSLALDTGLSPVTLFLELFVPRRPKPMPPPENPGEKKREPPDDRK